MKHEFETLDELQQKMKLVGEIFRPAQEENMRINHPKKYVEKMRNDWKVITRKLIKESYRLPNRNDVIELVSLISSVENLMEQEIEDILYEGKERE